jgi:probable HAF family extracellular repeat protein
MSTLRQLRNFWIPWVTTIILACFSDAVAQARYEVTDLGSLHNWNLGCAMSLNNHGWTETMAGVLDPFSISTSAKLAKGRAVINIDGLKIDLGTLGGPDSWMMWGGINDRGEAVGFSETSVPDPDGEDFCGFGTKLTCRPFVWRNSHMSALPTVGGNNGLASDINDHGQIAGTAQTTITDSGCPPYQTLSPIIWEKGKAQALSTVGSDPDAVAYGINNLGQAVGYSGTCTAGNHAVLWENGTASPLPDLGTQGASFAFGINEQGQIVGQVASPDGTTSYAALWQDGAITNLGVLPGDFGAFASGINNQGQVDGKHLRLQRQLGPWLHLAERRDDRPEHAVSWKFQPLRTHGEQDQRARTNLGHGTRAQRAACGPGDPRLSGNPCKRKHGQVRCTGRTGTPEIQFARQSWQTAFSEIRTRPIRAIKAFVRLGMCLFSARFDSPNATARTLRNTNREG